MEHVVTVNLAGNAYQMESSAHAALRAYLDRAEAALQDNPDKAEILRDLERAVADKARAYLSAFKSVIEGPDMAKILEEMGPVNDDGAEDAAPQPGQAGTRGPGVERRFFRIYDQHSWTGVSAGLGAYLGVDPGVIRALWVLAVVFSGGFAVIAYVVLMFVAPPASSPEDVAAAQGLPFTAREVVEQARRNFEEYADGASSPRGRRRGWRQAWRDAQPQAFYAPPVSGPARIFAGVFAVLFTLAGAALLAALFYALHALTTTGAVLGWTPPEGLPLWGAILLLFVVYGAASAPLAALQSASFSALTGGPRGPYHHPHGGVFGWILIGFVVWLLYQHVPAFHAWAEMVIETLRAAFAPFLVNAGG